jgi:hypothetical protein
MAKAKYPDPATAVSHFTTSVSAPETQAKWGTRAAEGAGKLGEWFGLALPQVYRKVAALPAKPKDPWLERSKPVGQLISNLGVQYRKKKLSAIAGVASPATPA